MDITSGFEPLIPGSSPGRCTSYNCGYGLVVEHVLAKDETGVRFPLPAQKTRKAGFIQSFLFSIERVEGSNCFDPVGNRKPQPCRKATGEVGSRPCEAGVVTDSAKTPLFINEAKHIFLNPEDLPEATIRSVRRLRSAG